MKSQAWWIMNYLYGLSTTLIAVAIAFAPSQMVRALTAGQIEKIAAEITVFIPEKYIGNDGKEKQANGSGTIIAKRGNTYAVLTASHVVCRDPEGECKNYRDFKVVTHDGIVYTVNLSTVKKVPGVDLAVFQFNSDRNYQLATLGNYQVQGEQLVFACGWPDPKFVGKRKLFRSVGKVLPPDITPLLKIYPPALGYDLLYTSVTHGGMSGGPVLDTEGRIIAVHGQNEGERIEGVRVYIGFSLAIPISTFLQLAPQLGISRDLSLKSSPPPALSLQGTGAEFSEFFGIPDPNNTNPLDWLNHGNKMWRLGQLIFADAAYDRALQLNPDLYQAWFGKALLLTYQERYQEAIAAYDRALQINPGSETMRNLRDKLIGITGITIPPQ